MANSEFHNNVKCGFNEAKPRTCPYFTCFLGSISQLLRKPRPCATYSILLLIGLFIAQNLQLMAQEKHPREIHIKRSASKITIDGKIDEPAWQQAEVSSGFQQVLPIDTTIARSPSEVRLSYDDNFLYIAAVCHNAVSEGNYIMQSLKRDFSFPITDAFGVFLDPFNNHLNGICFSIGAGNMQREGTIENAGIFGVTTAFDTKWYSKVVAEKGRWTIEMAIPFKVLRYSEKATSWGINFARNDLRANETSSWSPVPRQQNVAHLAYTGLLIWDTPPPPARKNIALIPYFLESMAQNSLSTTDSKAHLRSPKAGLDAKIGLSSALNLDLSVLPDFAQVEVDVQVTNLDRFNLFFPERRTFFTENSDLFTYGNERLRPFFSRQVGLNDTLWGGVRLSGNLNKRWRTGLMLMQTKRGSTADKGQNYSVASLAYQAHPTLNIRTYTINKVGVEKWLPQARNYNALVGGELNYRSRNGRLTADAVLNTTATQSPSAQPNEPSLKGIAAVLQSTYTSPTWYGALGIENMGRNFRTDVGFLSELYHRNDANNTRTAVAYWLQNFYAGYKWYPKKFLKLRNWGVEAGGRTTQRYQPLTGNDGYGYAKVFATLYDQSALRLQVQTNRTDLLFPTNITARMDSLLPADTYRYLFGSAEFELSKRHRLSGIFKATYGGFYNGTRLNLSAETAYRIFPWGNIGLTVAYNRLQFPAAFSANTTLLLLSPRIEITFTPTLYWTTFVQYNTQIQNLNINSRLQWRFAPMSDIYLVFTDNLFAPDNFDLPLIQQKDWGIVLKASYWINL